MSKNTASNKFRKVNVDELDEDNYRDDDVANETAADVQSHANNVRVQLNNNQKEKALSTALSNPPTSTKDSADKQAYFETVMSVITAFKPTEISAVVDKLSEDECDVLMKYIYRGMSEPKEAYSASLLVWHKTVVAKAGLGCIMRVLTDRKRV